MDSAELAPDSLKHERRVAEQKVLKESVLENLAPRRMDSDERMAYDAGTAPPALGQRASSEDLAASSANLAEKIAAEKAVVEVPPPTPAPMEPPPTPFVAADGIGGREGGDGAMAPPDVMATPAPGDEDEEQGALIRWLSAPV